MTSSAPFVPAAASFRPKTRPLRILYAEDVRELRELMGHVVCADGHLLETCSNGMLACTHLRLLPFTYDLVITDHHMPVMNGLELVKEIRQLPYPGRIIVFSSELNESVHDEYLALGVDRVLAKPVRPHELRAVIAELFPDL